MPGKYLLQEKECERHTMTKSNPKGDLIDYCAQNKLPKPRFRFKSIGPAHEPTFECRVIYEGEEIAFAKAGTKKQAERSASELALNAVKNSFENTEEEDFDGPWPIFPELLAKCLEVADKRVRGNASNGLEQIQNKTLELYKGLLFNLGELEEE